MSVSYYDWTGHHARQRPNELAVIDLGSGRRLTHSDLNDRAGRLASWMEESRLAERSLGVFEGKTLQQCEEEFSKEYAEFKLLR